MTSSPFYDNLAAFRGFAILTIVAAHSWSFAIFWTGGLNKPDLAAFFWFTEVLFHGSTLYFAVLSGILFSLVLHQKTWSTFFTGKLLNVALPYLVMTVIATALSWSYLPSPTPPFINVAAKNVFLGSAMPHYWYLPVLAVLFAITPILHRLQKHQLGRWCLLMFALLPLVVSRSPYPDFLKPQSFVYFSGAYALGMLWGGSFQRVNRILVDYFWGLIAVAIVCSLGLWFTYVNDVQNIGFFSLRQSLVYGQKLALMAVLICVLTRLTRQPSWLIRLGEYAFAIYFIHVFFIGPLIMSYSDWLTENRATLFIAALGVANFLIGILGSLLVGCSLKWLIGRHARKLVGA